MLLRNATAADYAEMEAIARSVWHESYDHIIGKSQVEYMLALYQSKQAFERQTAAENYEYFVFEKGGKAVGYIGLVNEEGERLFLSKLYLLPSARGMGYGKTGLDFALERAKALSKKSVYLTVNKQNSRAIAVYEKCGFTKTDAIVTDIGNSFVMDDFVFEKSV